MTVLLREAHDGRWKQFYDTHMWHGLTSLSLYSFSSLSAGIYGVMFYRKQLFDT